MDQFRTWINEQDFSKCHLDEDALRRKKIDDSTQHFRKSLMCGLHAVNHILSALRQNFVTESDIDTVAQQMAERESSILYSMDPNVVLDLALDPRGNYAADTLLHLLHERAGVSVERWRHNQPISSAVILLGSGDHWQAMLMDQEKQWFVLEQFTKHPIQNVTRFLNAKLANGAVYEVGIFDKLPNLSYLDAISTPQHQKHLTTRSTQRSCLTSSPPRKKQHLQVGFQSTCEVTFGVDVTTPIAETDVGQRAPQIGSTLPGMILPEEFQRDPRFQFDGPSNIPIHDGFGGSSDDENMDDEPLNALLEAFSPNPGKEIASSSTDETEEPPRRSTRAKVTPQLYQSDEVEREEKAARRNNL